MLAGLRANAGYPEEGLEILATIRGDDREAFNAPEVARIEGELLLRRGTPRI